ncbi:MAG: HEAT repeat domain-containing protein [Candidatus Methylumidiphilus sp.]
MLDELTNIYSKLVLAEDSDDYIFEFKNLLLSSDGTDILDFHFLILGNRKNEYLYHSIRSFFSKRKDKEFVSEFLYNKYQNGITDDILKADVIQILGNLRSKYAYILCINNIRSNLRDIRYRCIIVLGWVGTSIDLPILYERMVNDPDGQLRGFSATAMRQIWYKNKNAKDEITKYLNEAIRKEENEEAIIGMIITLQDLQKKKFGIKESQYGDISGDVVLSKQKAITNLDKMFKA